MAAIQKNREFWIESGAKWWNSKVMPNDWILEKQLGNIPSRYR